MKTNLYKLSCAILIAGFALTSVFSQDMRVEDILAKNIEAKGGKELLSSLKSMVTKTSMKSQQMAVSFTSYIKTGFAAKTEIELMGQKGYSLVRKDGGWEYYPFQGMTEPKAMSEKQHTAMLESLNLSDPFIDYESKGSFATLLGFEDVNGEECYKVSLITKDGKTTNFDISSKSFRILKESSKVTTERGEIENSSEFSDFVTLPSGYSYAKTIKTNQGTLNVDSLEINVDIPQSTFELPKDSSK